jgi:hypothetical protein
LTSGFCFFVAFSFFSYKIKPEVLQSGHFWPTFLLCSTRVAMVLSILERVRELAEPVIKELNLDLVDLEYLPQKGRGIVRITIDKETGVTLDDCTKVSREVWVSLRN